MKEEKGVLEKWEIQEASSAGGEIVFFLCGFLNGRFIVTSVLLNIDFVSMRAETLNSFYMLGEKGEQ